MANKTKKDVGPTDEYEMSGDELLQKMKDRGFFRGTPSDEEIEMEGKNEGMYACHDVTVSAIKRLRRSLEDVWSIEYSGVITPQKQVQADKILFAIDTLATLDDIFADEYDTKLAELRSGKRNGTEEEDFEFRNPS